MKSNHQCRLCGRWLEGEWNATKDPAQREALQAEMNQGRCFECPSSKYDRWKEIDR